MRGVATTVEIGLFALALLVFLYLLVDCLRRRRARFPTISYGGRGVSPGAAKWTWVVVLLVAFLVGHSGAGLWEAWSGEATYPAESETGRALLRAEGHEVTPVAYQATSGIYVRKELRLIEGQVHQRRAVRLPWLFLAGVLAYTLLVKRWPMPEPRRETRPPSDDYATRPPGGAG